MYAKLYVFSGFIFESLLDKIVEVLGIFPVAAYNGGPRNVTKLAGVMNMGGAAVASYVSILEPLR